MPRMMVVPELVGNLYSIAEGLSVYTSKFYSSGVAEKLLRTDPILAERFAQKSTFARLVESQSHVGSLVEDLVTEGAETVTGLREHLVTVSEVERFIQRRRLSEAMNFVGVPLEEYELRLAELVAPVSRLRPVHVLVHEHCAAVGLEYLVKEGDEAGEEEPYRELKRNFNRPLMDARDAFFQDASDAHLERYVATALELAEQEHPLATTVGKVSFILRLPARGERAAIALDRLSVASLMAPLLVE